MPTRPSPVLLSRFTAVRREPTRPAHARDAGFAEQFDADTLFFDCFRSAEGGEAILLGPPLLNLQEPLGRAILRDRPHGPPLPFRMRPLDRHAQIRVSTAPGTPAVFIETSLGSVTASIGDNECHLFEGRRVLLTLSRNNPLGWILDWVRFNRDVHGADAVLLYDNGSDIYTPPELEAAITALPGIDRCKVVHWPFKYGPQGLDAVHFWDSDFCQLGAWEHARWRFLARARSVMNSDVDELVVGKGSAFSAAEASPFGLAVYDGRWIVEVVEDGIAPTSDPALRRHRDYATLLRRKPGLNRLWLPVDANACRPKWTVVPGRCPVSAQWHVHGIKHWFATHLRRRDLCFRHFRPISTSWKYHRGAVVPFDPALHERDTALIGAMSRVAWER